MFCVLRVASRCQLHPSIAPSADAPHPRPLALHGMQSTIRFEAIRALQTWAGIGMCCCKFNSTVRVGVGEPHATDRHTLRVGASAVGWFAWHGTSCKHDLLRRLTIPVPRSTAGAYGTSCPGVPLVRCPLLAARCVAQLNSAQLTVNG